MLHLVTVLLTRKHAGLLRYLKFWTSKRVYPCMDAIYALPKLIVLCWQILNILNSVTLWIRLSVVVWSVVKSGYLHTAVCHQWGRTVWMHWMPFGSFNDESVIALWLGLVFSEGCPVHLGLFELCWRILCSCTCLATLCSIPGLCWQSVFSNRDSN